MALLFDGTNDYLFTSRPFTDIDNWTLATWVNYPGLSRAFKMDMYNGEDGNPGAYNGYGFGLGGDNGGSGSKLIGLYGGIAWKNTSYTFSSADTWYHVVMVRTSGTLKFYVNGSDVGYSNTDAPQTVGNTSGVFSVGAQDRNSEGSGPDGMGWYANTRMAEVAAWQRALSVGEIAALGKGFAPSFFKPSLMRYFRLSNSADKFDLARAASVTTGDAPSSYAHPRIYYPDGSYYFPIGSSGTNVSVSADVVTLTGSIPTPTVTAIRNVSTSADVVTTTLSIQEPTVTGKQNVSTSADVVTTTGSLPDPTITTVRNVSTTADVVTLTGSLPDPAITTIRNASTTADVITLTGTLPDPTVSADSVVNVSTDADLLTATLSIQAPTITAIQNVSTSADVVTATLSIPAPTITTTRFVSVVPDAVVLASSLPEPTVTGIQNVSTTADLVNLTGSLPSATITGSSLTTADLLSLAASLPAPTITAIMNASVTADLITTTLSIPEPTLAVEGGYSGNASWGIDINTFGLVMNKKARIPTWTTSSRPTGRKGLFGWNKVENRMEIYDPDSDSWYYVSGTQI